MIDDLLRAPQVLVIRSDDALIFKFDVRITDDQAAEIRHRIAKNLPPEIRFLVVGAGVEIGVVRKESE